MLLARRLTTHEQLIEYMSSLLDKQFCPKGVDTWLKYAEQRVREDHKLETWPAIPSYLQPVWNGPSRVTHPRNGFIPGLYTYVYDPDTNVITVHLIVEAA